MNKKVKTILIAAAGCIGAGAVLMGIGSAMGGTLELGRMNASPDWADVGDYDGEEPNMEQEVFSGDFETEIVFDEMPEALDAEIGVHGLKITEGDDGRISLKGRNADRIQCYVENGTLYLKNVRQHKKYKKTNGRELTLTVPAGTEWKRAALDADLGYISAETLSAETVVLDAEMGSIELGRLKADTAETSGEMGNVEIAEGTLKGLKAEANMGNIVFAGTIEGAVEADCEMGNVTLKLSQKKEDFQYTIRSEMGEISIGGEKYGAADGREKTVSYGAGWQMDLETSMGSIEILFE